MMMMVVLGEQEGTLLALILSGERASLDTRGTRGLTRGLGTNVPETVTLNFRDFGNFREPMFIFWQFWHDQFFYQFSMKLFTLLLH